MFNVRHHPMYFISAGLALGVGLAAVAVWQGLAALIASLTVLTLIGITAADYAREWRPLKVRR